MKFCILSSGSKSNCFYIESDNTAILIDIGMSYRSLVKSLAQVGRDFSGIRALFITHEHSDHTKGLASFIKGCGHPGIPVFINSKSRLFLDIELTGHEELSHGKIVNVGGGLAVLPLALSHDAANTFGFKITDSVSSLFLASDTGCFDSAILDKARGSQAIAIESNHDAGMLRVSEYPAYLKKRIGGRFGHLSNDSAARFIEQAATDSTRHVFFLHLSQNNNSPGIVEALIKDRLSVRFPSASFHIAGQGNPPELIDL
ncbi:MAG: MBL fold metallo-hydrolase [Brevinematales bacterium]|jgi:phosphoribosyl 1,2-cyclic phosphodiesterase